ncbi:MAG: hypothetical protein H0W44_08625 [Gammaproteobacteria bacterium]|nr:hypothetical protein [Gammaproteobacteria bacterium]
MNDFVTVYDISQAGYVDQYQALLVFVSLLLVSIILLYKTAKDVEDRLFRYVGVSVFLLIAVSYGAYQYPFYKSYQHLKIELEAGRANQFAGIVWRLGETQSFSFFDTAEERFRYSPLVMPHRLGFQAKYFNIQKGYLVQVATVDEVIVRLAVHKNHFEK